MTAKEAELNIRPLIKFSTAARIEDIRKGRLYLKSLAYFRELEEETGDDVKGDILEAAVGVADVRVIVPEKGIDEWVPRERLLTVKSNDFVFCATDMHNDVDEFQLEASKKEYFAGPWSTALIIEDRLEFLRRLERALNREGLPSRCGYVNYYDESENNVGIWVSMCCSVGNIAFWKRLRYSWQQEYRIVVESPLTKEDHLVLEIGDISDISRVVCASAALEAARNFGAFQEATL